MKKLLLLLLFITPLCASAQYATVTAHVVDIQGTVYQSCRYNVDLLYPGGGTGVVYFLSTTQVIPQTSFSGAVCDSSGNLSITLVANDQISPALTKWRFSICDHTQTYCFTYDASITGTAQDISAGVTAAAALLPQLAGGTVDTTSIQTISGNKTFSGTTTFSGTVSLQQVLALKNPSSSTQALWPTTAAVTPGFLDSEMGSSATPATAKYLTKPDVYFSRYDATDASACVTGLGSGCMAPIVRIEGKNVSTTTSNDLNGILIDLHSPQTTSQAALGYGNSYVGITPLIWDSGGVNHNLTALFGVNPNVGADYVPSVCWKGTVDVSGRCARNVIGTEIDVTNNTAADGVRDSSIGNNFAGVSIGSFSTNATPKDNTSGIYIFTGTTGHGFKSGLVVGGASQVGITIPQQGIASKPDTAIHIGTQGNYGLVIGSGSKVDKYNYDVPTNGAWALANPQVAGVLYDAARVAGTTGTANSTFPIYRVATGATSYKQWKTYYDLSEVFHWQHDHASDGVFVDALQFFPSTSEFLISGASEATGFMYANFGSGNYMRFGGTPTGARVWTFQDTSGTVVGRDTTDTLTNKTLTSPVINTSFSGTAMNPSAGHAVCWKSATTLGYCSTVTDASGLCTCN